MKKEILFILHLPPPVHGASMAGSYVKDSKVINSSFDCTFISLTTANSINDIGKTGLKKSLLIFKIAFGVISYLIKNKCDLCYMTPSARTPTFYKDFFIILILKLFRVKIIYHFHNKGVAECSINKSTRLIYASAFKNTEVILLSNLLYPDIASYVNAENVYICPNGIPVSSTDSQIRISKDNSKCQLLFVGNMIVSKGVYVLLNACEILKNRGLEFECHFVGDWLDVKEEDFKQYVQRLGIGEMIFAHGKKYNDEKNQFYLDADMFVFPTFYYNEAFSLVNLEAMQFGLPVISTTVGGIPDAILEGETGFLVPPEDAVALADKVEILINDAELRKNMGKAAKKRFDNNYTLSVFESRLKEILEISLKNNSK